VGGVILAASNITTEGAPMIANRQRAESRTVGEIQRAETYGLILELAGMVLTYHPVGYMIRKGEKTIAEHLVISQVEDFVANLEHQPEPQAWWDRPRGLLGG
jgi:hypothetical protein